ncbi:uncharacterized protein LOC108437634 [Pygocentrus nattereri]|uniref:uncharacterized protein LOC108437634 n=1 Tax=Pygocentrus nattereri TaxID=42514 RepID=UPI00081469C7|nr:uncharacterized protein LOC108437634 [Pygocentrus nattereri]
MVLLFELRFFGLWTLWWCCLVTGSTGCQMQYVGRSSVTTDLQSDVLLPCNFKSTLLGSNKTADIVAVWSQRTIPADNLLEISLQGGVMFWNNRDKRIKTFTKLSESGNFSILLRNVQQSDLGLYRCELHEGINCSIAYQEVQLGLAAVSEYQKTIIAGTSGGAAVLLLFTVCVCYTVTKRRLCMRQDSAQEGTRENPIYDSANYKMKDSRNTDEGQCDNPIYAEYSAMPDQHRESSVR